MALAVATPCPRCGRPWIKWALSPLSCHARCYFAPEIQDDILWLKLTFAPRISDERLARDLGVPIGVIRSSLAEAKARAGFKVARWGR